MSYRINKTNGDLLIDLTDGIIDTSSTDITLVGRNYKGFGEYINENFVAMLENFAATSAPANPLEGQLWYDTQEQRLKIYNGTNFKVAGGPIISAGQPQNLTGGDLWIDNEQNKLYFFDGTDLVLVGPQYNSVQGKTSFEAVTMVDTSNQTRVVLALYIAGVLAGIYSSANEFTPRLNYNISPYPTNTPIKRGFNPVSVEFKYQGTATSAEALQSSTGQIFTPADFVRSNERDSDNNVVNQEMDGGLFVKGAAGLEVGYGANRYAAFKTVDLGTLSVIDINQLNYDFAIRVRSGSDFIDAVRVDSSTGRVGIFTNTPEEVLDVNGNARINGNINVIGDLSVGGATTYINATTLRTQDKNMELAADEDGNPAGGNLVADGGGITLLSTDGNKTIEWLNSTGNWTSNQHWDLVAGREFRINNSMVISSTAIGTSVTSANGLTSVGTLTSLGVAGDITIGGNIVNTGAMQINTGGTVTFNNQKIAGVLTPDPITGAATDVATKGYVDDRNAKQSVVFSLDISGLTLPNPPGISTGPINQVAAILENLSPATTAREGCIARIHCTSYGTVSVTGINVTVASDTSGVIQKTSIAVDSGGTQNETVIQDIAAANAATGTTTLIPDRYVMEFVVNAGGSWVHSSTVTYTP